MQKTKLIKVLKKQAIILGIWTLGAIAGASAINWYYLLPTLENQTVFEQRGCVSCDTIEESKPEMAEDNLSGGGVAIKPKAQEESTRLEADSHSVKKLVEEKGKEVFGEEEVPALIELIDRESDFNHTAQNPTSTAYGLFQFLDGTWSKYGEKTSDPNKQIEYGLKYIKDRYKTPSKALAYHNQNNSY